MAVEVLFPVGNEKLDNLMEEARRRFPLVKVYWKETSLLMKFVFHATLMRFWNPHFMTRYHTTIGNKVYMAGKMRDGGNWPGFYRTMRHELMHIVQGNVYKVLFALGYTFPQCLAPLSFLAISAVWLGPWALLFLLFILVLAPMPAPWRKKWELEGYTQTMLARYEETGDVTEDLIEFVARQFTSSAYYYMWPFKSIYEDLYAAADKIKSGEIEGTWGGLSADLRVRLQKMQ